MSDIASKLNVVVFAGLAYLGYLVFSRPQDTAPPDDPWFGQAVVAQPDLVVVKFGAEWCGPCRMLDPELSELGNSMRGLAQVVRIDIDKRPELARHYGVSSIPRIMVFYHGKILADRVGYADHNQLREWVKGVQIQ